MKGGPFPIQLALVRELLKAPLWLVAITPGYIPPPSGACKFCRQIHTSPSTWGLGPFNTLEDVMAAFRRKRPEGRWLVWVRGADGEMVGVDSQTWEALAGKEIKIDQEGGGRPQHHPDTKDCL